MSNKFSQEFIKKQEKKLLNEAEAIKNRIEELKKDDPFSDPDRLVDNAAIDTDAREQIGHDTIEAEIKELKKRLSDIELAISKIKKGKYGTCENCDELIPIERLKLMPEARRCMSCERKR